ncbi:hypothetical protein B0H11DRAFT_1913990 [Mycena galericulata]|nr:hypothetical protein B0H11DRAFT_1913990 [Mycena galericulata]
MTTLTISVFFRPRPDHPQFGMHWMPAGGELSYGPFHELQGPIPADATEEILVACSAELWGYWREFYADIRPLLLIERPPFDTVSLRTHWHTIFADDYQHRKATIARFLERVEEMMLMLYPAVSSEHAENKKALLCRMAAADFPDMDDATIQRKMWVCVLCELQEYHRSIGTYKRELHRRTTGWEHTSAAFTFAICRVVSSNGGVLPQIRPVQQTFLVDDTALVIADHAEVPHQRSAVRRNPRRGLADEET